VSLNDFPSHVTRLRKALLNYKEEQQLHFLSKQPILKILDEQTSCHDKVLLDLWSHLCLQNHSNLSLCALGGYGNRLLFPGSDIDLLILHQNINEAQQQLIAQFITHCWDVGLKISHSIRNFQDCEQQAKNDDSFYTALLSFRLITGNQGLFDEIQCSIKDQKWRKFNDFFKTKCQERIKRISDYTHTEYNLEPNLKEGSGGIRDLNLMEWLMSQKFGHNDQNILSDYYQFSDHDIALYLQSKIFIYQTRFALHMVSKNKSERLYFQYQEKIADLFKITGDSLNQKIGILMKKYYTASAQIANMVDYIVQFHTEQIILYASPHKEKIDDCFEILDGYLNTVDTQVIVQSPEILLKLFHIFSSNNLTGLTSQTIKAIHRAIQNNRIDFLNTSSCKKIFIQILQQKNNVHKTLLLMHKLGVLQAYIPEFKHITGQMQYDLFHQYTVDAHTLILTKNLDEAFNHVNNLSALYNKCMNEITQREVLYIAGLFHDIGKGHQVDHCQLGFDLCYKFCQAHELSDEISDLCSWLVKNHLLMSYTAQHHDIWDVDVIKEFAQKIQTKQKLAYLYLLTAADMMATNSSLWNSWRQALLSELFQATVLWLKDNQQHDLLQSNNVQIVKEKVYKILDAKYHIRDTNRINQIWQQFQDQYFIHENAHRIAWHTQVILEDQQKNNHTSVAMQSHWSQAATDLFIYCNYHSLIFAKVCALLEKSFLSIVEARVHSYNSTISLNFVVINTNSTQISYKRVKQVQNKVIQLLSKIHDDSIVLPSRHISRAIRFFSKQHRIEIKNDSPLQLTVIEIHAPDFPGLLARIALAFLTLEIEVLSAKINTLGNKIEDIFYVVETHTRLPLGNNRFCEAQKIISRAITGVTLL